MDTEKRHFIFGRDNYKCQICFCDVILKHNDLREATIDHIIPRSKGGSDDDNNLLTLCKSCNSYKNIKSLDEVKIYLRPFLDGICEKNELEEYYYFLYLKQKYEKRRRLSLSR